MKNLESAISAALQSCVERNLREGAVKGMCLVCIETGGDKNKVQKALSNAVGDRLANLRTQALEIEKEIDMLLSLKKSI